MTALAEVLAAPADAVVHRIGADVAPAAVERAALAAGWRFALVESVDATTKSDVLATFRTGLGLADWFGHNLDALVDALRDVGDREAAGTVVLWDRPSRFETDHPADFEAVLDVLAERAGDGERPRLVVVVRPAPTEA